MVTLSVSKKQAKTSELEIAIDEAIDADFLVHTMKIENFDLVIILCPDTFYSYTAMLEKDGQKGLSRILKAKINKPIIQYTLTTDKSTISKVSTVARKYQELITRYWRDAGSSVKLVEIEKIVNGVPYKFLNYISPAELERQA